MVPDTLGVLGLGAVGGSIAWQAARLGVPRILGYDASTRDGVAAVKAGAVTELVRDAATVVANADFVVIAGSGDDTRAQLCALASLLLERGVFCTDVTAVKRPVVALAEELGLAAVFAGSHPHVGPTSDGFRCANPGLLSGTLVYVTPVMGGDRAADEVRDFWTRSIGANPVALDATQHDQLHAWTGHLPQTVASALAAAMAAGGPAGVTYGNSALEATRQARCGTALWAEVLVANRDNVLDALRGFAASLDELREALAAGNRRRVETWLTAAADWRGRFEP